MRAPLCGVCCHGGCGGGGDGGAVLRVWIVAGVACRGVRRMVACGMELLLVLEDSLAAGSGTDSHDAGLVGRRDRLAAMGCCSLKGIGRHHCALLARPSGSSERDESCCSGWVLLGFGRWVLSGSVRVEDREDKGSSSCWRVQ